MKHHEREYFVSRVRSGFYSFSVEGKSLKVYMPTIEDDLASNEVYVNAFNGCIDDGIKTQKQMFEYLNQTGEWTTEDFDREKGFHKDIDRLKLEIYNHRHDDEMREKIRGWLRKAEQQLLKHTEDKSIHQENTCEGIAMLDQAFCRLKRTTYSDGELFHYDDVEPRLIWITLCNMVLPEDKIRTIARTEPWRSIWILSKTNTYPLFSNKDRELSIDQKNLLIWSRTYDNIGESPDCPPEDVLNDNDMLDGWFIDQKNQRESDRSKSTIESKLANSSANEVFMVVGSGEGKNKISKQGVDKMNDAGTNQIKQDRFGVMKQQGVAKQQDFRDEKLNIMQQQNQNFKDNFKR